MNPEAVIRVERVIEASPEEVFEAWSDADSLAIWMCPSAEMKRATVDVNFRVGGRFRIVMHDPERDYAQHGEYLEIDAPKRIVFTWISEWLPTAESTTRVSVALEPEADGRTRLVLVHDCLPEGEAYVGHSDGWSTILTKLAAAVASAEVKRV